MNNHINTLNQFFKYRVPELYKKYKGNKSRNKKINIINILTYLSFYCKNNNTKSTSAHRTNINSNYTSFDKKIKNIPIKFFESYCDELRNIFNSIMTDPQIRNINTMISNNPNSVFYKDENDNINIFDPKSVDGSCYVTYRNNKLFTNMDLHIYDNLTKTPMSIISNDINFRNFSNNENNNSNKNNEIELFMKFLNINLNMHSNTIYIMDRAYTSYKLIKYLIEHNIKFIIRLKDTLDIFNDDLDDNIKKSNNAKIIKFIKGQPNIKLIKSTRKTTKDFALSTKTHEYINVTETYHLITNLGDCIDYSEQLIINLYSKRWEIESYIGILKKNFKYSIFNIKDDDQINKIKLINNSVFMLTKLLILISLASDYDSNIIKLDPHVHRTFDKSKYDMRLKVNKNKYEQYLREPVYIANVYVNYSEFLTLFYDEILINLLNGNLYNDLIDSLNKSLIIKKDKKDRKFDRKSLVPFSKWYVKMYHKIYKDLKIYKAIIEQTTENLDKNLKVQAHKIIKKNSRVISIDKT